MRQKFSMGMWRQIVMLLIIGAMCSILAGCSATRLAYANAETVSYWWLDGYLDLDTAQSTAVKTDLAFLFEWHRRTQLPDYIQLLETQQTRLRRATVVSEADLQADASALKQRWRRLSEKVAPALADLAILLQPAQLARLQDKFASNNDAYRKEYLKGGLEERQRRRFKKTMEQAKYWFGDFTTEQEALIRAASNARPQNAELVYADRLQRQQALIALIVRIRAEKMSRGDATDLIIAILDLQQQHLSSVENQQYFEAFEAANVRLVRTIFNIASAAQRAHALDRVSGWIRDLRAMARS